MILTTGKVGWIYSHLFSHSFDRYQAISIIRPSTNALTSRYIDRDMDSDKHADNRFSKNMTLPHIPTSKQKTSSQIKEKQGNANQIDWQNTFLLRCTAKIILPLHHVMISHNLHYIGDRNLSMIICLVTCYSSNAPLDS